MTDWWGYFQMEQSIYHIFLLSFEILCRIRLKVFQYLSVELKSSLIALLYFCLSRNTLKQSAKLGTKFTSQVHLNPIARIPEVTSTIPHLQLIKIKQRNLSYKVEQGIYLAKLQHGMPVLLSKMLVALKNTALVQTTPTSLKDFAVLKKIHIIILRKFKIK